MEVEKKAWYIALYCVHLRVRCPAVLQTSKLWVRGLLHSSSNMWHLLEVRYGMMTLNCNKYSVSEFVITCNCFLGKTVLT